AVGAGLEWDLTEPARGIPPERDDRRDVAFVRTRALHHPERGQRQDGRAGIVGEDARIPRRPARRELRSVEQEGEDERGANGPDELCDVVVLREVLAYERDERQLGDFDELDRTARDVERFPPADTRVKDASEVVLVDLTIVERPTVMLGLADVKP